jgi:hypothetical protein
MAIPTSYKYAIPISYKYKEYARYAAHCLNMVSSTKDQDARAINRSSTTMAKMAMKPIAIGSRSQNRV